MLSAPDSQGSKRLISHWFVREHRDLDFSGLGTQRREMRYPVDFRAKLRALDSEARVGVRIVDMSASGLGISLPIEVKVGTIVSVEFERGTVVGEIRHCVPVTGYFRAGLAIQEFIRVRPN